MAKSPPGPSGRRPTYWKAAVWSSERSISVWSMTGAGSLHRTSGRYCACKAPGWIMIRSVFSAPPAVGSSTMMSRGRGRPCRSGRSEGASSTMTSIGVVASLSAETAPQAASAGRRVATAMVRKIEESLTMTSPSEFGNVPIQQELGRAAFDLPRQLPEIGDERAGFLCQPRDRSARPRS
jgi:hypothetical protein